MASQLHGVRCVTLQLASCAGQSADHLHLLQPFIVIRLSYCVRVNQPLFIRIFNPLVTSALLHPAEHVLKCVLLI